MVKVRLDAKVRMKESAGAKGGNDVRMTITLKVRARVTVKMS